MRHILLVVIITLLSLNLTAQRQDESRFSYGGMQQLGIIVEADRVRALPNLINGIRFDNWFAGIGVAYELDAGWWRNERVSTMPLYLDVRHYFFKKKWVFALADVGTNLIVGNEWMQDDNWNRYRKKVGYYANVGGGIKARLGRETFYSFDVSYNFKQTRYEHDQQNAVNLWEEESNNFKQQRILIRLGIEIK